MDRIIIAMKDKPQSQKLAIVLSSSYDSTIVDTVAKLRALFLSENSGYYTVIYEEEEGCSAFTEELENLRSDDKVSFPTIRITPQNSNIASTENNIIIEKPFGPKELITTLGKIGSASSAAIA